MEISSNMLHRSSGIPESGLDQNSAFGGTVPRISTQGASSPERVPGTRLSEIAAFGIGLGRAVIRSLTAFGEQLGAYYAPQPGLARAIGEVTLVTAERAEQATLLRVGEFVKPAPNFRDQVHDTSRTQIIEYITGTRSALGAYTDPEGRKARRLTEHQSLVALESFLVEAKNRLAGTRDAGQAASMLEHLTFIGKPEYDEATEAIAATWKAYLRANPDAQLCVLVGQTNRGSMVKSDAFLLENVLAHFNDDELDEFAGRLIDSTDDIRAAGDSLRIVMLDDWVISGSQLSGVCRRFATDHPDLIDRVEVHVIVAPQAHIRDGLEVSVGNAWSGADRTVRIPLAAYYLAHHADREYAAASEAHITGWHCAVDYDFNMALETIAHHLGRDMPPATNIVRPYRRNGVKLTQRDRLDRSARRQGSKVA